MSNDSIRFHVETIWLHRHQGNWMVTLGGPSNRAAQPVPAAKYFQHHMGTPLHHRILFESQSEIDAFLAEDMTPKSAAIYEPMAPLQTYISEVRKPKHQALVLTFDEVIGQMSCSKVFDPRGADGTISFQSLISAQFEEWETFSRPPLFANHKLAGINHLSQYLPDQGLWGGAYRYKLNQGLQRLSDAYDLTDSDAMIAAGARRIKTYWLRGGRELRLDGANETTMAVLSKVRRNTAPPIFVTSTGSPWYQSATKFISAFDGELWMLEVPQPEALSGRISHFFRMPVARSLPLDVMAASVDADG